jgi:hypothetical protein
MLMVSGDFPDVKLGFPLLVHHYGPWFSAGIVAIAAPRPLSGFQHQSALHRIAMHVAQLLHPPVVAENHEVVETPLAGWPTLSLNLAHSEAAPPLRFMQGWEMFIRHSVSAHQSLRSGMPKRLRRSSLPPLHKAQGWGSLRLKHRRGKGGPARQPQEKSPRDKRVGQPAGVFFQLCAQAHRFTVLVSA